VDPQFRGMDAGCGTRERVARFETRSEAGVFRPMQAGNALRGNYFAGAGVAAGSAGG
jgi:hypothetical protein